MKVSETTAIRARTRREAAAKTPLKISRANLKAPEAAKRSAAFQIPKPYPGVLPKNGTKLAMDDNSSLMEASVWATNFPGYAFNEGLEFLGYPYLAELSQRPEYRRIVEVIATEATRKWIRLETTGEVDKSKKITEIQAEMSRLNVQAEFKKIAEQDGFFGRAHLYFDLGVEDDTDELKTPIGHGNDEVSKTKVRKGSLKAIRAVEAVWTYPTNYNSNDPLKGNWYKPDMWFVMGKQVHATRLMTFIGREVPDLLKPAYSFGGLALTQMAKPYVDNWLTTRQSVNDIIQSFSTFVLKSDMAAQLQEGGDAVFVRAELFNNMRNNRGLFMLDKDKEDFENVSAPLGSLDALQAQSQEHMAAVSGIPLVKLLGIQPQGLNASSEGELRSFYDWVADYQISLFKVHLKTVLYMVQLSLYGEVDEEITVEFEPLWAMDEAQEATMRKTEADTDQVYVDMGVLSQEEVRTRLASDPSSPYPGLNPDDMPDLIEEEEEGLQPEGGRPNPIEGKDDPKGVPTKGKSQRKGSDEPGASSGLLDRMGNDAAPGDWDESKHKRAGNGQFGSGGSGASEGVEPNDPLDVAEVVWGSQKKPTKAQSKALNAYLGVKDEDDESVLDLSQEGHSESGGYIAINKALRNGRETPESKAIAAYLDKASLPHDMTLYRGVSGGFAKALLGWMHVGGVIPDAAFMSASLSPEFVEDWTNKYSQGAGSGHSVMLEIRAKKGQKAALGMDPNDDILGEMEVLIQKGSELKVTSFDPDTGKAVCELVQSEDALAADEAFELFCQLAMDTEFNDADHPHAPAGSPTGGQFVSSGEGGGTAKVKAPPTPGSFNAAMQKISKLPKAKKKDVHVLMNYLLGATEHVSSPTSFHNAMKTLAAKSPKGKKEFASKLNQLLDSGNNSVQAYKKLQDTFGNKLDWALSVAADPDAEPAKVEAPKSTSNMMGMIHAAPSLGFQSQGGPVDASAYHFKKDESSLWVDKETGKWTLVTPGHMTKLGDTVEGLDALLAGGDWQSKGVKNFSSGSAIGYPIPEGEGNGSSSSSTSTPHAEALKKIAEVRPQPTGDQTDAISSYKGSGYVTINDTLRRTGKFSAKSTHIKEWLDKAALPEDTTLWRAVNADYAQILKSIVVEGTVFQDRGFISTSTNKGFSDSWGSGKSGLIMQIDVKKGQKGASIRSKHEHDGEYEVLLQAGSRLKVLALDFDKGTMHCELDQNHMGV